MSSVSIPEHFFRHEYGRLVAILSRRVGVKHIEAIQDAVQSALAVALETWKGTRNPLPLSCTLRLTIRQPTTSPRLALQRTPLSPEWGIPRPIQGLCCILCPVLLTEPPSSIIFTLVGEYLEQELDELFFSLSHETRRHMVHYLASSGESKVTDLARSYRLSLNTVSKHIKILERARLVTRKVSGREHHISFNAERLRNVDHWLKYYRQFWTVQLEGLARYFEHKQKEGRHG